MRWIFGLQNQTGTIGWTTLIVKPEHYADCFLNKFLAKKINNGNRSITYTHARVRCTRASKRTQRWGCVGGATETTPCALQARRVALPLAQVDLEHQQRHVADGGCPRPRQVRVVCVLRLANAQSRLRGEWEGSRSRRHHYPIPSARGEAGGVCQWLAEHSRSNTSKPMIRGACSADKSV